MAIIYVGSHKHPEEGPRPLVCTGGGMFFPGDTIEISPGLYPVPKNLRGPKSRKWLKRRAKNKLRVRINAEIKRRREYVTIQQVVDATELIFESPNLLDQFASDPQRVQDLVDRSMKAIQESMRVPKEFLKS